MSFSSNDPGNRHELGNTTPNLGSRSQRSLPRNFLMLLFFAFDFVDMQLLFMLIFMNFEDGEVVVAKQVRAARPPSLRLDWPDRRSLGRRLSLASNNLRSRSRVGQSLTFANNDTQPQTVVLWLRKHTVCIM